jgi:hypothetical protein
MRPSVVALLAAAVALLGACSVKEEKTTQHPAPGASAPTATAPAATTTSKTYSLF